MVKSPSAIAAVSFAENVVPFITNSVIVKASPLSSVSFCKTPGAKRFKAVLTTVS